CRPSSAVYPAIRNPQTAIRNRKPQRRPEVVVFQLQPIERSSLAGSLKRQRDLFGQGQEVVPVPAAPALALARFRQPLAGILADRLQQPVARLSPPLFVEHQGLVDEGGEQVQDFIGTEDCRRRTADGAGCSVSSVLRLPSVVFPTDRFRRFQRPPTGEDREA